MLRPLRASRGHWDAGGSKDGLLSSPRTSDVRRRAGLTGNVLEGQVAKRTTSGHGAGEDGPAECLPAHGGRRRTGPG